MKKLFAFIAIIIFTVSVNTIVFASDDIKETYDSIIEKQLEAIDKEEFDALLKHLNSTYEEYIPQYELKDFLQTIRGQETYDLIGLLKGIAKFFFHEFSANLQLLGQLIVLSIICAVLRGIQSAFENDNIGKVTFGFIFLIIIIQAIHSLNLALNIGTNAIDQMVSIIQALLPIILTLLVSLGGFTSAAIFNPIIFLGITIASTWIRNILLPMIYIVAVLGLISNISDRFHVTALSSFIKQICVLLLGIFLSIFLGIIVVQGAAASTVDGISIRTAKFASKNFIPIVGGFFSDAIDAIVGCSLILKSAIGIAGLIVVFLTLLFPVLKILALIFIYRLAVAVVQPLGEKTIVKCLNDIAGNLSFLAITVSSVALMFFIAITVIIASGNITVMMR